MPKISYLVIEVYSDEYGPQNNFMQGFRTKGEAETMKKYFEEKYAKDGCRFEIEELAVAEGEYDFIED
jgi:hypothetical protein